jgi:hypothetical protein
MPTIRAKFTVDQKTMNANGTQSVRLVPVTCGSEENKQFYKWTPGGAIDLAILNPAAADAFEVGKPYYIDFTPA